LSSKEVSEIQGGSWLPDIISNAIDSVVSFTAGVISYALDAQTSPYPPQGCVGNN
jgi:hypothetical protein